MGEYLFQLPNRSYRITVVEENEQPDVGYGGEDHLKNINSLGALTQHIVKINRDIAAVEQVLVLSVFYIHHGTLTDFERARNTRAGGLMQRISKRYVAITYTTKYLALQLTPVS